MSGRGDVQSDCQSKESTVREGQRVVRAAPPPKNKVHVASRPGEQSHPALWRKDSQPEKEGGEFAEGTGSPLTTKLVRFRQRAGL